MGKKANAARAALGDKYIGKHGTNKIRGAAQGRHNHAKLRKINEKQTIGTTLTQAKSRLRAQGVVTEALVKGVEQPAARPVEDAGERILRELKQMQGQK